MFAPYYRGRSPDTKGPQAGSGLGLAITRLLAEGQGRHLRLESSKHGTSARLALRLWEA
ncbi:MAG: ATP-binding protein [Chloroflexi bacterium]|nr:ATP-binding protein [Chloroflexota bacterium]